MADPWESDPVAAPWENDPPAEASISAPVAAAQPNVPFPIWTAGAGLPVAPEITSGLAKSGVAAVAGLGDYTNRAAAALGLTERDAAPFEEVRAATESAGTGESVGRMVGDTAQFLMVPGPGKVANASRAVQAVRSVAPHLANAGLTAAQTGSDTAAGVAGVASAVLPPVVRAGVKKGAEFGKYIGNRMVRSVVKPTVAAMRRIGGTEGGLDARANQLVDWIIRNGVTSSEKAQSILTGAEQELQRLLATKNAPTDAATRAKRYLDALERRAKKAALSEEAVSAFRSKMDELLRGSMGEDSTRVVLQSQVPVKAGHHGAAAVPPPGPTLYGPNGEKLDLPVEVVTRKLRSEVPAAEALESARVSTAFKSNPQNTGENAALAARQAVERAQRDAVKVAVPGGVDEAGVPYQGARELLKTEANAIAARDVLGRGEFREGNQNLSGIAGAVAAGTTNPGGAVLGFAARLLREGQLGAGVKVGQLARAVQAGNTAHVAAILRQLGVALPSAVTPTRASIAGPVQ